MKNQFITLYLEDEGNEVSYDWVILQDVLTEIAPKANKQKKQKGMTDEILQLLEGRRRERQHNQERYNELNRQIKAKCTEAKEEWIKRQCEETEMLQRRN